MLHLDIWNCIWNAYERLLSLNVNVGLVHRWLAILYSRISVAGVNIDKYLRLHSATRVILMLVNMHMANYYYFMYDSMGKRGAYGGFGRVENLLAMKCARANDIEAPALPKIII